MPGLLAVAALPALVGLGGADYTDPAVFGSGFRSAMVICAGLLVLGALVAAALVRKQREPVHAMAVDRQSYCAVCGPATCPHERDFEEPR